MVVDRRFLQAEVKAVSQKKIAGWMGKALERGLGRAIICYYNAGGMSRGILAI